MASDTIISPCYQFLPFFLVINFSFLVTVSSDLHRHRLASIFRTFSPVEWIIIVICLCVLLKLLLKLLFTLAILLVVQHTTGPVNYFARDNAEELWVFITVW